MTVQAKICGINSVPAAEASARAEFAGFNFYPRSPRSVTPAHAQFLAGHLPREVRRVALVVDFDDAALDALLSVFRPDILQLHGHETPARTAEIRARTNLPVMKVLGISTAADLDGAAAYLGVADRLLFDAKPPRREDALPGGNAVSFDWTLLAGRKWTRPWMLAGGLTPENVAHAIDVSGAPAVDVSSGVESRPGHKSPRLIRRFLAAVRSAFILPKNAPNDQRVEWLIRYLKCRQAELSHFLTEAQEHGRREYSKDEWIWNALVSSMATYGGEKRARNIEPYLDRLAWHSIAGMTPDARLKFLCEVMNLTSQRPGKDVKGIWLAANFVRIQTDHGPGAFKAKFEAHRGNDAVKEKLALLEAFDGIGPKYSRNIMMDAALDLGMKFVAIDDRLKRVGSWLRPDFEALPYLSQEAFFTQIGVRAGLANAWTLDRILFRSYGDDVVLRRQLGIRQSGRRTRRNCR